MSEATDLIRAGDVRALHRLLVERPEVADERAEETSLLAFAAYLGQAEAVTLIRAARTGIDAYEACILGEIDCVDAMLAAGWSPDTVAPDGFTALGLAASFRQTVVFDRLLPLVCDVNARAANPQHLAALHAAASAGAVDLVERLLAAGADPNVVQAGGLTALHLAAARGDLEMLAVLLRSGADRSLVAKDGQSAAAYALAGGHERAAALLS